MVTRSLTHDHATPGGAGELPTVTVVVPTYNRAGPLGDTLAHLSAQDYPAGLVEIVVVDNSSADHTEDVVAQAAAASPFPIRFCRKDNHGPAASRNYAIARSTGDVIAFTDSDCTMAPDWLRTGVSLLRPGVGLVAGTVQPINNPERVPGFFYHQISHTREDYIYATANAFYRREVVEELGGFNEGFGTYPWGMPVGGEDTDLAWRTKRAGYGAVFAPELVVRHQASNLPPIAWMLEPIRSFVLPRLVRDVPEIRAGLWNRYFLSRDHAFFYPLLGAGVAWCTGKKRAALLLALPWVIEQRSLVNRDVGDARRWWRIPVKFALMAERHTVLTLTIVASSIKHRTVVL